MGYPNISYGVLFLVRMFPHQDNDRHAGQNPFVPCADDNECRYCKTLHSLDTTCPNEITEIKKKAAKGDEVSTCIVAIWTNNGENGCTKNEERALDIWMKRKVDTSGSFSEACMKIEKRREEGDEDAKVISCLLNKAYNGFPQAMFDLGRAFQFGSYGLHADLKFAYKWYKNASDAQHPLAMIAAGYFIAYGLGGAERDVQGGIAMISSLAKKESVACLVLAQLYYNGIGNELQANMHLAREYLLLAMNGNWEHSLSRVGAGQARELLANIDRR